MRSLIIFILTCTLLGIVACHKEEGTLEKAGKKVDDLFEKAGEKLDD